jgi:hypothetical protein
MEHVVAKILEGWWRLKSLCVQELNGASHDQQYEQGYASGHQQHLTRGSYRSSQHAEEDSQGCPQQLVGAIGCQPARHLVGGANAEPCPGYYR